MPKIIEVLSKDRVPLTYFIGSYCVYIKLSCIAKHLIWTHLNVTFSVQYLDFFESSGSDSQ